MGALSVDDRRKVPALQAADLHAYEVHKYFSDQLNNSGRGVRKSFSSLMEIKEAGGGGYLFNRDRLQEVFALLDTGQNALPIAVDQLNNKERVSFDTSRRK